ncbi:MULTISPECIES: histidine phosphatase family protein [unclassified Streptomyces]|uniref:histidine phosphatase family protein n=1 Tax=unclassified Streptomyces TaxID=2593676 RepID=UPI000883BAF3|nr:MULTISPECIES: histidine phosphatase family protein [unclassified Streptomyces]PBC87080.1 broad specificity phosphatase PhoE [Streptomyces sp. 2321.6]SDQ62210.1 Broad specificity phosphatase PhoE [Streptomyces sp. KS_16]SEE18609.1 Broad specificity phosphatase PhoE [Streptomyces sp. 2133.1]SNC74255.1 Broad specificity phosphatase PhoE [Streptomyces sp. 2114.4]
MAPRTELTLAVIRHAESTENATKPNFYLDPRPWTATAAHALSRDLVGLTPRGFEQCLWLRRTLPDLLGPDPVVRTSQYRRSQDTAALALPGLPSEATAVLNEQHYGDATYMTKRELFATYPEGVDDRRLRKHLWVPPGEGGESLAGGVLHRANTFITALPVLASTAAAVVAITHHTAILALRTLLEGRPVTDLVDEARRRKTPNGAVLLYRLRGGRFEAAGGAEPDC